MKKLMFLLFIVWISMSGVSIYADENPKQNATELLQQLEGMGRERVKQKEIKKNDFQDGMNAYLRRDYKTAFRIFKSLAEQGDAMAQLQLGELYETGIGVSQDYTEAAKWYRKASEQGEFHASQQLFLMYFEGRGIPKDVAKAKKWARKANEQEKAYVLKFYRKEAERGKAYAQFELGKMYAKGKDVPQDYSEAVKWYRKAAEQGHGSAQNNLGVKYSEGKGIPQDYVEAHKWFNIAGAKGIESARRNRDEIEKFMSPEQIAEAQKRAGDWKSEIDQTQKSK